MDTERKCDGCTLCCKTHGIYELTKAAGRWCIYCRVGEGCAIYSTRPSSCEGFQCAWLAGFGLPEYRPDKTGIVPEFKTVSGLGLTLFLWAEEDKALDSSFVKRQTGLNLERGTPVMYIPVESSPKLYMPYGKQGGKYRFSDLRKQDVEVVQFQKGRF